MLTYRPAEGEKLLGAPGSRAVPGIIGAGSRVRLSPAIDRVDQTTNRVRKCGRKSKFTYYIPLRKNLVSMLRLSLKPTILFLQFRHPQTIEHLEVSYSHEPIRVELTSCGKS